MAIYKKFKSTIPSMSHVCKDGMVLHFLGGVCIAENPKHIEELETEIGNPGQGHSRNPYIYVDADDYEVDSEALSPLEQIKADAYAKAKADIMAAMSRDASTSAQGPLGASLMSSANAAQAADSDSNAPQNLSAAAMVTALKGAPAGPAVAVNLPKS